MTGSPNNNNNSPLPSEDGAAAGPHTGAPLHDVAAQSNRPTSKTSSPTPHATAQSSRSAPADSTTETTAVPTSASLRNAKQDTSADVSSSEGAPTKGDDDKNGFQPYGTRSRHRPGPRPNYNDDVELPFESAARVEAPPSKRSTPSDLPTTRPQPSTDTLEAANQIERPKSGFTAVNASATGSAKVNGNAAKPNQAANAANPATDTPPPRQKRKYVWKNGSRPTSASKAAAKESAAAAAAASASARASDTQDPPPAKKRKTGDGISTGFGPTTSIERKSSMSYGSRALTRDSCVVTFEKSKGLLKDGKLHADDGSVYAVNDHAYLICEPPGDPYYLCRIMEFRRDDMNDPKSPVTSMIVNWFYRPKDIGRFSADPRFLFASMQSDESPINSLRGKCEIRHRSQIKDLDEFRKRRDTFWFNQLYDRYIHRPYDMVPAASVINVPKRVKKAIDDRWKFLVVEGARLKELTSAVKSCKRCGDYCAPNDSVDCGVCRNTYHMACVRPPLAKKPSRGFAWSCGPCSRAREKKLEARHTSILPDKGSEAEEELQEEEDDAAGSVKEDGSGPPAADRMTDAESHTQAEVAKAQMWPWRYLGIHCSVEDVLQYDDRAIYPRASSRLGAKHQAVVAPWYGRPVELVALSDVRKKYGKGATTKKDAKLSKDALATLEKEKVERANRPKWMQDEPVGYVARGEDYDSTDSRCTAQRLFVLPEEEETDSAAAEVAQKANEQICDDFMSRVRALVRDQGHARPCVASSKGNLGTQPQWITPTNYMDKALNALYKNNFNVNLALKELQAFKGPKDFKDPVFTKEELKRFEDGVAKFGSELRLVRKHVKTRPHAEIVRFYYNWKKTERGIEIWGRHDARRGSRKRSETSWTEIADDEDDSAFDGAKSIARKRRFECKFCLTRHSRQWRRAPAVAPGAISLADPKGSSKDKANQLVVALCQRCAYPWRRYAIRWEDPEEFTKALNASGGKQWKRLHDELLLREYVHANEAAGVPTTGIAATAATNLGITLTVPAADPVAKKKTSQEKETAPTPPPAEVKKKVQPAPPPRPPTPPIIPSQPKMRDFPCAVCNGDDTVGSLIACASCRLTVHHRCYGVPVQASLAKWQCDTCMNDRNNTLSLTYNCVLCTITDRQPEMVEQPKGTTKKKTDRDKERERLEKQLTDELALRYKREQQSKGRPIFPREAVKRTASNNWMHVVCAVWTPEIKFDDAQTLENAEGMGAAVANPQRIDALCKLCKVVGGVCVQCNYDKCPATFHVGCAHAANYRFGFDIKPVKSSQKNSVSTIALGSENGLMTAVVYCEEHDPATAPILHGFHEQTESGLNALEAFVRTYKQADKSLTGTARKANMLSQSMKGVTSSTQTTGNSSAARRSSLLTNPTTTKIRRFSVTSQYEDTGGLTNGIESTDGVESRECVTCKTDTSFRWWPYRIQYGRLGGFQLPNGAYGVNGVNGSKHEHQWQCHKCHIKIEQGITPIPPPRIDDDDILAFTAKDYFELTMQPPMPPQHPQPSLMLHAPPLSGHPPPPPLHQVLQRPYPGQQWHGGPPVAVSNGGDPPDSADQLTKWTQDLWRSTITIHRPDGYSTTFHGREFGSATDDSVKSWNFLLQRTENDLGFDIHRHVLIYDGVRAINNCNDFVAALAAVIGQGKPGHATWSMEEKTHLARQQQQSGQQQSPYDQHPPLSVPHHHHHQHPPPPALLPPHHHQQYHGPPPLYGYQGGPPPPPHPHPPPPMAYPSPAGPPPPHPPPPPSLPPPPPQQQQQQQSQPHSQSHPYSRPNSTVPQSPYGPPPPASAALSSQQQSTPVLVQHTPKSQQQASLPRPPSTAPSAGSPPPYSYPPPPLPPSYIPSASPKHHGHTSPRDSNGVISGQGQGIGHRTSGSMSGRSPEDGSSLGQSHLKSPYLTQSFKPPGDTSTSPRSNVGVDSMAMGPSTPQYDMKPTLDQLQAHAGAHDRGLDRGRDRDHGHDRGHSQGHVQILSPGHHNHHLLQHHPHPHQQSHPHHQGHQPGVGASSSPNLKNLMH